MDSDQLQVWCTDLPGSRCTLWSVTVLLTHCPGFLGTSALTWDFHQAFSIILLTFSLHDQEWEELGSCSLVPSPSSAEAPAWVQQLRTAPPGVQSLMPHLLQCSKTICCLSAPTQVQWVGVNTNSSLGKKKKKYSCKVLQENEKGTGEQNLKMRTASWLRSGRLSSKSWQSFGFWRQLCHRSGRLQRDLGQTEKWFKYWSKYQNYTK